MCVVQQCAWLTALSSGCIHVAHTSSADATFDDFVAALSDTQACWGVVGVSYTLHDGGHRSKLVLVNWIPGGCPRTQKMQYAMFTGALPAALTGAHTPIPFYSIFLRTSLTHPCMYAGIHCKMQANSRDDLEWSEVLQRVSRFEHSRIAGDTDTD